MDALNQAKQIMADYLVSTGDVEWMRGDAAVYAAIAQAERLRFIGEQLKRIADALEMIAAPEETIESRAAMNRLQYP